MATKKLICEEGQIKLVTQLKSGEISDKDQVVFTDEVIKAFLEHTVTMGDFVKKRVAGYRIPTADGEGAAWVCTFDEGTYELKQREGVKIEPVVEPIPKKPRRPRKKKAESEVK